MARRGSSVADRVAEQQRDTKIVELFTQGKSQKEIGKLFGITDGRVSQIISRFRDEWTAKREVAVQDHIEVELAYVRRIREEALSAWERSKEDGVTVTTVKATRKEESDKSRRRLEKADRKLAVIRQEEKRVGQVGDVACLHVAETCTDKLLKLLGAYPKEDKTEINNTVQINWQELSVPIPSITPMALTPADEVEARIEAESKPPSSNNGNGNGHV